MISNVILFSNIVYFSLHIVKNTYILKSLTKVRNYDLENLSQVKMMSEKEIDSFVMMTCALTFAV